MKEEDLPFLMKEVAANVKKQLQQAKLVLQVFNQQKRFFNGFLKLPDDADFDFERLQLQRIRPVQTATPKIWRNGFATWTLPFRILRFGGINAPLNQSHFFVSGGITSITFQLSYNPETGEPEFNELEVVLSQPLYTIERSR